jgi:hypothetical protein
MESHCDGWRLACLLRCLDVVSLGSSIEMRLGHALVIVDSELAEVVVAAAADAVVMVVVVVVVVVVAAVLELMSPGRMSVLALAPGLWIPILILILEPGPVQELKMAFRIQPRWRGPRSMFCLHHQVVKDMTQETQAASDCSSGWVPPSSCMLQGSQNDL